MDAAKYNRSVTLLCPTCGSADMHMKEQVPESQIAECCACGLKIEKQALIDANGENIAAHIEEIGQEVQKDFAASIKKALRGNKFITVK